MDNRQGETPGDAAGNKGTHPAGERDSEWQGTNTAEDTAEQFTEAVDQELADEAAGQQPGNDMAGGSGRSSEDQPPALQEDEDEGNPAKPDNS